MRIKHLIFLIGTFIILTSCFNSIDGNGKVVTEKRKTESFNAIDVAGAYEIILVQGKKEALEIVADENLLEYIDTKVKNNTLFISNKETIRNSKSLKLYITVVDLDNIDASGAVDISNKNILKSNNLEIDVSGAADINLVVDIKDFEINLSGASETTLKGSSANFDIDISGAGELNALELETKDAKIELSGAASASIFVTESLDVDISGAGSVKYKGDPILKQEVSGAGSIKKIN